MIIALKIT